MKVYYSCIEVVIIEAITCYWSIGLTAYFAPITLFCSDSLFYISEHKDLSYFQTFNRAWVHGQLPLILHGANQTIAILEKVVYKSKMAPSCTASGAKLSTNLVLSLYV